MNLTIVILTNNEEAHIVRAISSVKGLSARLVVVDSGSSDRTTELARSAGAEILVHPFTTQAQQFNWALDQLPSDTEWVMRLDADEVVTPALREEISEKLPMLEPNVMGVSIGRRMTFLRRPIRYGGLFPIRVVRLFRFGAGRCEDRWMDEHIRVNGLVDAFRSEILDDNVKSLSWWTEKHNSYASREVVDLLRLDRSIVVDVGTEANLGRGPEWPKRWVKEKIYTRLPWSMRALAYFFYRYFVRLGFLDGWEGLVFHALQGFWYRFLVDAKLYEVKVYMKSNNVGVTTAVKDVLGIDVTA